MKKIKNKLRKKYVIFLVIGVLLMTGGIWQFILQKIETKQFPPVGDIYTINSHKMHLYSKGSGKDLIVFIAGSGTPCAYTDFYYLQDELQNDARTISFDQAGFGWSEKTDIPRTIDNMTNELHELLEKSKQTPSYILVAHSLASLEALRYAQLYSSEVKGIILIDGGSPNFYAKDLEINSLILNRISAALRVTGVNRLLGNLGIKLPFTGENLRHSLLPDEEKKFDAAMYYKHLGSNNNLDMILNINENAKKVIENGYLKSTPLLILSSDSGKEWNMAQQELLRWSNVSKQVTIKGGAHYIHWSNEKDVISNIKQFINENK